MYRSSVVSPYWIWARFHFSSPQNMEVSFMEPAWLALKRGARSKICSYFLFSTESLLP